MIHNRNFQGFRMFLLKHVKSLQDPVLGQELQFKVINESPFVQVLHTGGLH